MTTKPTDAELLQRCRETMEQLRNGDKRRTYLEGVLATELIKRLTTPPAEPDAEKAFVDRFALNPLESGYSSAIWEGWNAALEWMQRTNSTDVPLHEKLKASGAARLSEEQYEDAHHVVRPVEGIVRLRICISEYPINWSLSRSEFEAWLMGKLTDAGVTKGGTLSRIEEPEDGSTVFVWVPDIGGRSEDFDSNPPPTFNNMAGPL